MFCFGAARAWTATERRAAAARDDVAGRPFVHSAVLPRRSLARQAPAQGPHQVIVDAPFRLCGGKSPLRLVVTQRRRDGKKLAGESNITRGPPAGSAAPATASGIRCRDYATTWALAAKLFGTGWITITLKVVDAAGQASGAPKFAFRAPKP